MDAWLATLDTEAAHVSHDDVLAALDAARDEPERSRRPDALGRNGSPALTAAGVVLGHRACSLGVLRHTPRPEEVSIPLRHRRTEPPKDAPDLPYAEPSLLRPILVSWPNGGAWDRPCVSSWTPTSS